MQATEQRDDEHRGREVARANEAGIANSVGDDAGSEFDPAGLS